MEWQVQAQDARQLSLIREDITEYLRRHGSSESDFAGAALIVSELLSNVWRHTTGDGWVELVWRDGRAVLRVRDVGHGFEWTPSPPAADAIGGRGLVIVDRLSDGVSVEPRAIGATVTVALPVVRAVSVSIDPPRRSTRRLPDLSEATPGVGFEREAFLRALVVQLAATAESDLGPERAEALIAQVGIDIGTQMEDEYRQATGRQGPLDARALGECFVRLKAAIGADFSVVSIGEHHITLENGACPFGPVVQHAPGLCRMTSSVFGGITARVTDSEAVVSLDERIAVGDVGCRVTVTFGPGVTPSLWGHRYRPPAS